MPNKKKQQPAQPRNRKPEPPAVAVAPPQPTDLAVAESIADAAKSITSRAMLLIVAKGKFWNHKQGTKSVVKTEADARMYTLMKRLLDSPQLRAVDGVDRFVTNLTKRYALPSPFRFGVFLVPMPNIPFVQSELKRMGALRDELVAAFIKVYPEQAKGAADQLKELYDPRNYPTAEELVGMFKFSWQWVRISVPDELQTIDAEMFIEERKKEVAALRATVLEIRADLTLAFRKLVAKMVERLQPGDDGKPKMILKTFGDNLRQFCNDFGQLDITNDGDLRAVVAQAQRLCDRLDVEALREDPQVRESAVKQFDGVLAVVNKMVVDRPVGFREIELED